MSGSKIFRETDDNPGVVDDNFLPPPDYSPPESSADRPRAPEWSRVAKFLTFRDFQEYKLPQSTLSVDKSILTTNFPAFLSDPNALGEMLLGQALLPPKPLFHITGRSPNDPNGWGTPKTDFDVTVNLTPWILDVTKHSMSEVTVTSPDTGTQGRSLSRGKVPKPDKVADLWTWATRFCNNKMESKSFTLERRISNWDTTFLDGQVRALIASTGYKGIVEVKFPITYQKVVVRTVRHPWIERLSTLTGLNAGRAYDVVVSTWPCAQSGHGTGGSQSQQQGPFDEHAWWDMWKGAIQNAVLKQKSGWISIEDVMEAEMGWEAAKPTKAWGAASGWISG